MKNYDDNYRHKGLRKKLVEVVREKGITSDAVLEAIMEVPRHFYIDSALEHLSYEDRALSIADGQTISQPYTVAYQTQLLEVKRNEKILEIGTGSMYQASVLAQLGAKVYTIERHKSLFANTKDSYPAKKYPGIKFFYGDGFQGLPTYAPFDKIIITAAAPHMPDLLLKQLKVGGIMVIPITENGQERMHRVTKLDNDEIKDEHLGLFSFVPMLTGRVHLKR